MPAISRIFLLIAGVSLMAAAQLSAYGFHGLTGKVSAAQLASWEWANRMHFYHSLGLILIALLLAHAPRSVLLRASAGLMMLGSVLFCGGIYAETLGAPAIVTRTVPLGGGSFMLAWLLVAVAGIRIRPAA